MAILWHYIRMAYGKLTARVGISGYDAIYTAMAIRPGGSADPSIM